MVVLIENRSKHIGPSLPWGWAWVQLEFFVAILLIACAVGTLINKGFRLETHLGLQADRWIIAQAFSYSLLVLVSGLFLADLRYLSDPVSRWLQVLWSASWGCMAVLISFFIIGFTANIGWQMWPFGKAGPILAMLLVAAIFLRRVYRRLWIRERPFTNTDA